MGFNTPLEYDNEGYLNVDYSVLNETYWNGNRQAFVKEEKKDLDVIHGMLITSAGTNAATSKHAVWTRTR